MKLTKYKQKRNLKKSKEPKAIKKSSGKKLIYTIQEHHAKNLHWDLRLEIKGVLKSWAIPKQPPKTKNVKRLAIQVEDHPLEYAKFHGVIPKGQYGAGKVKIWDKGTYELIDAEGDPFGKKNSKKIIFNLNGKKLKGKYCLIKTDYGKNSWLFFKI